MSACRGSVDHVLDLTRMQTEQLRIVVGTQLANNNAIIHKANAPNNKANSIVKLPNIELTKFDEDSARRCEFLDLFA